MNCDDVGRWMSAHLDRELTLERSLAVDEHLEHCARCRAAWNGHTALRAAMARACEPERASAALRARVRSALHEPATGVAPQRSRVAWLAAAPGLAALAAFGGLLLVKPWQPESRSTAATMRVVYHIASADHVGASLRTLKNHLDAEPRSRVIVVAHNEGVQFLLRGARDEAGRAYAEAVRDFRERGVEFRVCTNTLVRRQITPQAVIDEAVLVPSGIAEISRLQGQEGYVYLRL